MTVTAPPNTPIFVPPADHDLTVIIPAYNEEKRLPWTLRQLTAFLSDWGLDYRVVVVDDGSTDGTATLAEQFGPRCSTIRMDRHGGKGRAVRTAMLRGTGRVLAFTDADLPFDLAALQRGYRWLRRGECEVVFGARDLPGAEYLAPRRLSRRLATFLFRQVARCLISREVTDTQCGLKLFTRRAALEIFARTTLDGFALDAEVVLRTQRLGLPFSRIPVTLVNDYDSSLSLRRSALPMLRDVLRIWAGTWLGRPTPQPQFTYADGEARPTGDRRRVAA
jgi:dolichyl-phosphate beta-glucosyltransferase